MQARVVLTLFVAGALAFGAVAASGQPQRQAGVVAASDPAGDVTAQGLTAAEAAAIDIVSIRAGGKEGIGIVVTVNFRGNFDALMGRGNLKGAVVALILRGKAEGSSAGLVTTGPGPLGVVLRHTRATKVGAVRSGRSVTFYVIGPGYGDVAAVSAEVLVKPPSLGFRVPAGRLQPAPPPHIPDPAWTLLLGAAPDDAATVSDPKPTELGKADIVAILAMIDKAVFGLERNEITFALNPQLLTNLDDLNGIARLLRLYTAQLYTGAAPPVTGKVTSQEFEVVLAMMNSGPDPLDAIDILLRGGARHTGARLVSPAGTCGPGSGPTTVRCIFTKPLPAAASATAIVATDRKYDAAQGVDLSVRKAGQAVFSNPFRLGVPAAPSACACADITVSAGVAHGNVTNPRGPVSLSLILNWTMSCTGASGVCAGRITVVPPGDLKVTTPPGATATCAGKPNCPDTSKGRFVVRMTSAEDLHKANQNVAIPVKIFCKSGASFVQVRTGQLVLHFGAHGLLDARHSDLHV